MPGSGGFSAARVPPPEVDLLITRHARSREFVEGSDKSWTRRSAARPRWRCRQGRSRSVVRRRPGRSPAGLTRFQATSLAGGSWFSSAGNPVEFPGKQPRPSALFPHRLSHSGFLTWPPDLGVNRRSRGSDRPFRQGQPKRSSVQGTAHFRWPGWVAESAQRSANQ